MLSSSISIEDFAACAYGWLSYSPPTSGNGARLVCGNAWVERRSCGSIFDVGVAMQVKKSGIVHLDIAIMWAMDLWDKPTAWPTSRAIQQELQNERV